MNRLLALILLTLPMVAQIEEQEPPPEKLIAPNDSAAKTEAEIDTAWSSFRRPTLKAELDAKIAAWARFCDGNGGLKFGTPARFTDDADPALPVVAFSHPQTFGADYIVLVRGANKIAMAEQLCLPVFTDGRKDERVMKAFLYADRVLEDVRLVTKAKLDVLIENGRLTPVVPKE